LAGGQVEDAEPCDYWSDDRGLVAFVHDAFAPLPGEYQACDLLWVEPPWRRGFPVFEERAGSSNPGRSWSGLIYAMSRHLLALQVPTVIVSGLEGQRFLPVPGRVTSCRLHGAQAWLSLYHDVERQAGLGRLLTADLSTTATLELLADHFDCVGDSCCGYGQAGYAFARAGKRFVLSDFNANCIGYIAKHAPDWHP
jgi:hypothetical protein